MYFKILCIKRMPTEDVSIAITTKIDSFEKRMMLTDGAQRLMEGDDYFAYYSANAISPTEEAKLFIYTENDDLQDAGNTYLSSSIDNLKMLCEMNEFPCVYYESPMEMTAIKFAIRDLYNVFPNELVALGSAFGLSDAEIDNLEAEITGADTLDSNVAEIPTDTTYVINNGTPDVPHEQSETHMEAVEDVSSDPEIKPISHIDLDELANKIAARLNHKVDADTTSTSHSKELITSSNFLKTQTETLFEWVIRVFMSDTEIDDEIFNIHSKIKGLLEKSLSYMYKAAESSVIKKDVASSATPEVKEQEKEEEDVKDTETEEKVKEVERSIYSDTDEVEEESADESVDESDTIMLQVAGESLNDSEFFNNIRRYKDRLSTEALDSIAKYDMYEKLTSGISKENSFVTYTKRKTALGL